MLKAQNWVEALKIDPEKLNEWSALAPDGVPLLVWCLQEGHVSAADYLRWACDHFELPVVRSEYFLDAFNAEGAAELHRGVNTSVDWSPWFFPVEKWENVTYVACVEPPSDFNDPNIRCILADARALQEAWSRFMAASNVGEFVRPEELAPEMPSGIDAGTGTVIKPFKLSLDDLDSDNMFQKLEPNKDELYTPPSEEPEIPALPGEKPPALAAEEPAFDDSKGSMMHTNLDLSKLTSIPPEPEAPRAPTPPVPATQPKPGSKPPAPAAKKKAAAANIHYSTEEQDKIFEETFEHLRSLYKNCFLMRCKDGKAILTKWDPTMMPNGGGKNITVDLAFPTFLRILHKTNLPYHGYLVDSPAHRGFFNELKIKELPGCVTAIPIKDDTSLVGVLVCIGDENLQKLDVLRKVEDASAKLVEAMAPALAQSAA